MSDYAKKELERLEKTCKDDTELKIQKWCTKCVLDLLELFKKQEHSGFSANYVVNLFDSLVHFKPLTPLTGEDDEWEESYCDSKVLQNKRCSSVFKEPDGLVYDIDYWYMRNKDGTCFGNNHTMQNIVFPYMPQKAKVLVDYSKIDDYIHPVVNGKRLDRPLESAIDDIKRHEFNDLIERAKVLGNEQKAKG